MNRTTLTETCVMIGKTGFPFEEVSSRVFLHVDQSAWGGMLVNSLLRLYGLLHRHCLSGSKERRSAPLQVTSIVEHVRPDDSDKHIGSKKLKLSDPDYLPSNAPMSADANLSSDDMRVECLLD